MNPLHIDAQLQWVLVQWLVIMALLTTAMCGPLLQWWLTADANPQTAPLAPRPAPIAGAEL